jgi:predicted phage baseplate assembly protein
MSNTNTPQLDSCGCCEAAIPRPLLFNRPGLPALAYRIGTHGAFLRRMLARLPIYVLPDGPGAGSRPLADLTTRDSDDPAIALLDAWATAADVLTFYQERIANEGYLRTATERRSLLELARAIGYELRPGVAAGTFLVFTVEDAPGAPRESIVAQGTKVQSVPAQGQLPQTFETSESITARAAWNTLRPRLTQPQDLALSGDDLYLLGTGTALDPSAPDVITLPAAQIYPVSPATAIASGSVPAIKVGQIYLKGTSTGLKAGDRVLLAGAKSVSDVKAKPVRVRRVDVESERDRTRVELELAAPPKLPQYVLPIKPVAQLQLAKIAFTGTQVQSAVLGQTFSESKLTAFLSIQGWQAQALLAHIARPAAPPPPAADTGVFAFRSRLGFFGHNAPRFKSIPPAELTDWDANPRSIWTDSQGTTYSDADVFLERSSPEVTPNSWVAFESTSVALTPYRVGEAKDVSLADYALSGKATGLDLLQPNGTAVDKSKDFKARKTTAYVQSERLALADLPIEEPVAQGSTSLTLDRMVLGLAIDQPLYLSGERDDLPGVISGEIVLIDAIIHAGGVTTLFFSDKLQHTYIRATVTLSANVVAATHGETTHEVLGSGDGAQPNQRFTLKKPPLTYVSAADASGAASTLEVRVNGVRWDETPRLIDRDASDESYIVRRDDDGKTHVIFGDGGMGARLPTGIENVRAVYRSGIGMAGMVDAESITLLQTRPLGVRGVTNPLPATGAADPESRDSARSNAPLTVLTLDRIVSLRDFEDFARGFAGVGKARAVAIWDGSIRRVHLTVAAASGDPIDPASALYTNLSDAIEQARDPGQPVAIDSYQPLFFNVAVKVLVDPRHVTQTVLDAVHESLLAAFAFDRRGFGQPVSAAEVVTVIQQVPGVIASDLDQFHLVTHDDESLTHGLATRLPSAIATWNESTRVIDLAQLLLINPAGIAVEAMSA